MARARAVFCYGRADDAAHPGGRGSRPFAEARRHSAQSEHRGNSRLVTGPGTVHPRSGRGLDSALAGGSAPGQGGRVALFRRIDRGENRRGPENLSAHGEARLGSRHGLVTAGIKPYNWETIGTSAMTRSVSGKLKSYTMLLARQPPASAP